MGGGGPGKIGQEADKSIYEIVTDLLARTKGIQSETFGQGAEALLTGDIGAQRGAISQGISNSMSQASTERQIAQDLLATKGLARTPIGQRQLAAVNLEGKQRTALVQPQIINDIIQRLAPALTGQSVEIGVQGLGDLADAQTRYSVYNTGARGQALSGIIGGVGQLGAAGIQYAAGPTTPPPLVQTPPAATG